MSWIHTFSLVIRSNVTALSQHFENPERVLRQLLIDMEEELQTVRASVAGVIADEIQLGRKVKEAREESEQWRERAAAALKRDDEESARAALEQKVAADQRAESSAKEHARQKQQAAKLQSAIRDLEHKITQARNKRALLAARLAGVESTRNINTILRRVDDTSALGHFERLEERVQRAEALEEAYGRLEGTDPAVADLERRFADQEAKERLKKELDELKKRVSPEE